MRNGVCICYSSVGFHHQWYSSCLLVLYWDWCVELWCVEFWMFGEYRAFVACVRLVSWLKVHFEFSVLARLNWNTRLNYFRRCKAKIATHLRVSWLKFIEHIFHMTNGTTYIRIITVSTVLTCGHAVTTVSESKVLFELDSTSVHAFCLDILSNFYMTAKARLVLQRWPVSK